MTRRMKNGLRTFVVALGLAIVFTFMPAFPGLGIGAAEVNAANPTKGKMDVYTYTNPTYASMNGYTTGTKSDLEWEITGNGTLILGDQSDPANTQTLYMPKKQTSARSNGQQMLEFLQPNDWPWQAQRTSIKRIEFASKVKVYGSLYQMFSNFNLVGQPDFTKFDTSEATSMREMFMNACAATDNSEYSFSALDVGKVTDMSGMFQSFSTHKIDISGWDTSNVKSFNAMFNGASWVDEIVGLENLEGKPTDLGSMFLNTHRLKTIEFSPNFDTTDVVDMSNMFNSAANVRKLNLSTFKTSNPSKLVDINGMFYNMNHLESLTGFELDTSNCNNLSGLFDGSKVLAAADIQAVVNKLDITNAANIGNMFANLSQLKTIDITSLKTDPANPKLQRITSMFSNCDNLEEIIGFSLDTKNVIAMNALFNSCHNLKQDCIQGIINQMDFSSVYLANNMFVRCNQLKELSINNLTSSHLESIAQMFFGCTNLKKVTMMSPGTFKGNYVLDVSGMFNNCAKLKEVDVSALANYKIQNLPRMFKNCYALEEIKGVEKFDFREGADNAKNFADMFLNCRSLKSLDVSGWNNSWRDSNMVRMFANCTALKIDGILDWDLSTKTNDSVGEGADLATFLNRCETFKETELAKMGADSMDAYPEDLKTMVELAVNGLEEIVASDEYTTNIDIALALQNVKEAEEAVKTQLPTLLDNAQKAADASLKAAQAAQGTPQAKAAADKAVADAEKAGALAKANYSINVVYYGTESQQAKDAQTVVTTTSKTVQDTKVIQKQATSPTKKANTLSVKGKTATIKVAKLKKNQTLAATKVIKFTNKGQGTLSYKKASGNKKITINAKSGKVTVKKGLKKGTYKVKVKVTAAGNASNNAATKVVTFKIKVK